MFTDSLSYSGLSQAGKGMRGRHWEQGYRTFKLKIGVWPDGMKLKFSRIDAGFCQSVRKLRLDANGDLVIRMQTLFWTWHRRLEKLNLSEQPLPVEQFEQKC